MHAPSTLFLNVLDWSHGSWEILNLQYSTNACHNACTCERASSIVFTANYLGSLSFCIDYRKLNFVTVEDICAIVQMDGFLSSLCDVPIFSRLTPIENTGKPNRETQIETNWSWNQPVIVLTSMNDDHSRRHATCVPESHSHQTVESSGTLCVHIILQPCGSSIVCWRKFKPFMG